jgi:hypothetical protein
MAVTANGTPYVESSDLVANYPAVSLALAEHIDGLGKVLQIVRATDTTSRITTSTSFVDVTGMSVTITPTKSTSIILVQGIFMQQSLGAGGLNDIAFQITTSANTALSGAENLFSYTSSNGSLMLSNMIGYSAPATTSAVTYKLRFRGTSGVEARSRNDLTTGQLIATEVSA